MKDKIDNLSIYWVLFEKFDFIIKISKSKLEIIEFPYQYSYFPFIYPPISPTCPFYP